MDRYEINSGELDKIGSKLIASSVLSESEIDKIAASPFLYAGVKARVASETTRQRLVFGLGRRLAVGFGSLFILMGIAALVLVLLRGEAPTIADRKVHVPVPQKQQSVSFSKSESGDMESLPGVVMRDETPVSRQFQNASYRKTDDRSSTRRKLVPKPQPDLEFYPLSYAGDPKENVSGGRVLQVELSRSSLFAMGFNIPIEDGAELVKADLLVGPDGVARGIRLH